MRISSKQLKTEILCQRVIYAPYTVEPDVVGSKITITIVILPN